MTKAPKQIPAGAAQIMGALVRMPPKPHDELKVEKRKAVKKKNRKARTHQPNE